MARTACYATDILDEARGWLMDCGMDPDDATESSDGWIRTLVTRHYDGGWTAFLRDAFPS